MGRLINIKRAPIEIAQLLYNNKTLMSLITNINISDPESDHPIDWTTILAQKYISLCPPLEDGTITGERDISLIILLDRINMNGADSNMIVSGKIYINAEASHILDSNYNNMLLEIVDEICSTIDGVKLTSSGQIVINSINYIAYSTMRCGYGINFSFTDQDIQKVVEI